MKLSIQAIGRMKSGPERELADRYLLRLEKTGRSLGMEFSGLNEYPESRASTVDLRKAEEAQRLEQPAATSLIVLDERGRNLTSSEFARVLSDMRDNNTRNVAVLIGGPDGISDELRRKAEIVVAFGKLTWPHQLVRILLAEQLYRAMTIIAGHPYHRA